MVSQVIEAFLFLLQIRIPHLNLVEHLVKVLYQGTEFVAAFHSHPPGVILLGGNGKHSRRQVFDGPGNQALQPQGQQPGEQRGAGQADQA